MKSGFYMIPLSGLKEGNHLYDFKIDDEFFAEFEESEIKSADLTAFIRLIKRSAHVELKVELKGSVEIMCDRCLENFFQEINAENDLFIKYGNNREEVDDKVVIIPFGESGLDLKQLIYEFAHLGLPLQRIHPDDKKGNSTCSPEMLMKLGEHMISRNEGIDPRWQELNKLKDNLSN